MPSKTIEADGSPITLDVDWEDRLVISPEHQGDLPRLTKEQALIVAAILRNWARGVDLDLCEEVKGP